MGRREEINPGELFLIADRTILVDEYESIIGDMFKMGKDRHEVGYLFTFKGKINNKDEYGEVTVCMPVKDAWNLFNDVLKGLELLRDANN